jgi:hypothetical protein
MSCSTAVINLFLRLQHKDEQNSCTDCGIFGSREVAEDLKALVLCEFEY